MDDESAVRQAMYRARDNGAEIEDGVARTIASWYHSSGNGEAALRFIATGEIATPADDVLRGLLSEDDWRNATPRIEDGELSLSALDFLGTYLVNRTDRSAVPGWSTLWAR